MRQPQIFISYRRDDAAGYARAVGDELARRFGAERVFMDVDDIDPGQAFAQVIERAVGESKVLLVLMGRRWLGEREGRPARIADADDFVQREVAAALARGMTVIPLLLDGAPMPTRAQLPEALRPLTDRHALEIGNTRFAADLDRLVGVLSETLGEPAPAPGSTATPARPGPGRAWRATLGGAVLLVAALGLLWQGVWPTRGLPEHRNATPVDPTISASAGAVAPPRADRPAINGEWHAEVTYDWPNARYPERFIFAGDGADLHGSASFLGVRRGVLEGRVEADGLRFVTRTSESGGAAGAGAETAHRYRGRLAGDEMRFVMQTEGGSSSHGPVEFVARRAAASASQASR